MKNNNYVLEKLITFEGDFTLFDLEIYGYKFWHLIRFQVFKMIEKRGIEIDSSQSSTRSFSFLQRVLLKIKQFNYFIKYNPLLCNTKYEILVFSHQRRNFNGNYYVCLYTDYITKHFKNKALVLEDALMEKHLTPIEHNHIIYNDYINLAVAVRRRLSFFQFNSNDIKIVKQLTQNINDYFKINIDEVTLKSIIKTSILKHKFFKKYYSRLLKNIEPKVILEVVSYEASKYSLNEVANEMKIPVIELQHGTMGSSHEAYNFKHKQLISTFPNYLFVYGEYWKKNTRLPISNNKIRVTGWPYLEHKVSQYESRFESGNKKNVLFISQGTVGKELSRIAIQIASIISEDYKIIYKLHPGEFSFWKDRYPWLVNSKVEVVDSLNEDIHYYFSKSICQIGVYSTAIYEGLLHGLKTVIIPIYRYYNMKDLHEMGLVTMTSDITEIIGVIYSEISPNLNDFRHFFLNNSQETSLKEIQLILNEN